MNNQIKITIILFFGAIILYVLPLANVDAAKIGSGVTINAPSTETEKICDDTTDNDNDGKIDAADEDCAAAPVGPTAGTCGLELVSGVPINYGSGSLNPGPLQITRHIYVKNVGDVSGKIMVKGGDWISDAAGSPTVSGPEITYVTLVTFLSGGNTNKMIPLKSSEFQLAILPSGVTAILDFTLKVPNPPPSGFSGSLHQELSIDLIC